MTLPGLGFGGELEGDDDDSDEDVSSFLGGRRIKEKRVFVPPQSAARR
jgi:hypothetical protein